jgi:predicted membrane protein
VSLTHILDVLSLLLGGSCLILVAADLVWLRKMTRRQIGLSLAFGALFTAVGLLGLLRHLTPEWLVSFFAVLGIIFIVMGPAAFMPEMYRAC